MNTTLRQAHKRTFVRAFGPVLAASIAVVALLSACAAPTRSPVASNHAVAHATSPAHSQPATPPQLAASDCAGLATLPVIQAALTSTAVTAVSADSNGEPPIDSLDGVAARQTGALFCAWADPSEQFTLALEVIPNATAAFTREAAGLNAVGDATGPNHVSGVPTYGDQSWSECYGVDESPDGTCEFDIRVGSSWLSIGEQDVNLQHPYPQTAAEQTLLTNLVSSVRALPRLSAWTPPADSLTIPTTCADAIPLTTMQSATGESGLASQPIGFVIGNVPWVLTHSLSCDWESGDGADVVLTVVPGSAWAGTPSPSLPGATPQAGLGSAASGGCQNTGDSVGCDLLVKADNTWFELDEGAQGSTLTLAPLTSLAHAFLTSIGAH